MQFVFLVVSLYFLFGFYLFLTLFLFYFLFVSSAMQVVFLFVSFTKQLSYSIEPKFFLLCFSLVKPKCFLFVSPAVQLCFFC